MANIIKVRLGLNIAYKNKAVSVPYTNTEIISSYEKKGTLDNMLGSRHSKVTNKQIIWPNKNENLSKSERILKFRFIERIHTYLVQ